MYSLGRPPPRKSVHTLWLVPKGYCPIQLGTSSQWLVNVKCLMMVIILCFFMVINFDGKDLYQ